MGAALQPWITVLAGPILTLIVLSIWRYRDTTGERINVLDKKFETKFDTLSKLLTENLITLSKDVGELKGASHKHVPSN